MKLLLDENLSPRLVKEIATLWPESAHVDILGMRGSSDSVLWAFARDRGFAIVSKDSDFRSLALVRGAPPKVIWLQIGNSSTAEIAALLRRRASRGTNQLARWMMRTR